MKAAPGLEVHRGILYLRDRGYAGIDEIGRIARAGGDCIYRHKANNIYRDPATGKTLDLSALLGNLAGGTLDIEVFAGKKGCTKVRLLARKLPEEEAASARRDLKKAVHGHCPSQRQLDLCGWNIFITTIGKDRASFEEIWELYALRWRIEIIFKTWKGKLHFGDFHPQSSDLQCRLCIVSRLLMAVLTMNIAFPLAEQIAEKKGKHISLLKLTDYLNQKIGDLPDILQDLMNGNETAIVRELIRNNAYDKRNDRKNYLEKLIQILYNQEISRHKKTYNEFI